MKRIHATLATTALVFGFGVAAAVPAYASAAAPTSELVQAATADPAVVSCNFGELYNDAGLTDFQRYVPRDTELTVTGGDNDAWEVTVQTSGNPTGYMSGECVRFLA